MSEIIPTSTTSPIKVLILPDGLGWVVDRNTDCLIEGLKGKVEFTRIPYTQIEPEEFKREAEKHDLIHYQNWDIARFMDHLPDKPLIVTVRSHKYSPEIIHKLAQRKDTYITVTTKPLQEELPFATHISNGIFDQFKPDHEFTVGWAGNPERHPEGYKGEKLIEKACHELGVRFKPAKGDVPFEKMPEYFRSLDLYVCASLNEGFSTDVMECLAMNVPVLTVDVGIPKYLNVHKCERSVEGIKQGIEKFYTQDQVKQYKWESISKQYYEFFTRILRNRTH